MEETVFTLRSEALGNERSIWVTRAGESNTPSRLILFLDGELYRQNIGAPAIISSLVGSKRIHDTWVVYVSAHSEEARMRECPCFPPFAVFIAREVIPELVRRFPAIAATTHRVLAGVSYTGLAAGYLALETPGVFQHVIAQSGSFWWNEAWLIGEYAKLRTPLATAFYLDVGAKEKKKKDHIAPGVEQTISQIEGVERMRDTLSATGHRVHFEQYEGGHDFRSWRETLPHALVRALPLE